MLNGNVELSAARSARSCSPRQRLLPHQEQAVSLGQGICRHGAQGRFVGRRRKKRDFRRLWIVRINAAAREHGLSYSAFIQGLEAAGVTLDRKMLADLAAREPKAFAVLAEQAKAARPAPRPAA